MDFDFDSNLGLADGWRKVSNIKTLKSATAKTRIQFFCPIGNLILESFPESEILCGR